MCKAECSDIEGDDRCQRKSVTSSVGRNYIRRRRVIILRGNENKDRELRANCDLVDQRPRYCKL